MASGGEERGNLWYVVYSENRKVSMWTGGERDMWIEAKKGEEQEVDGLKR